MLAADLGAGPPDEACRIIHSGDTVPKNLPAASPLPKIAATPDASAKQWIQVESRAGVALYRSRGKTRKSQVMPMYQIAEQRYSVYWQMQNPKKQGEAARFNSDSATSGLKAPRPLSHFVSAPSLGGSCPVRRRRPGSSARPPFLALYSAVSAWRKSSSASISPAKAVPIPMLTETGISTSGEPDRERQRGDHRGSHQLRGLKIANLRQQNHKLIPSQPDHGVAGPDCIQHPLRGHAQHFIARLMARTCH